MTKKELIASLKETCKNLRKEIEALEEKGSRSMLVKKQELLEAYKEEILRLQSLNF